MPRIVEFEGQTHEFPDDATDAEIAAVLESSGAPAAEAEPGFLAGKSLKGLGKNFARNAAEVVPRVAKTASDLFRIGVLGDVGRLKQMAGEAAAGIPAAAQVGIQNLRALAQHPTTVAPQAAREIGEFAYQQPVDALSMVVPPQAAASVGGLAARGVTKIASRNPEKLLAKSDKYMNSTLRATAAAERNNPDKNFARILSEEGHRLGLTKGAEGIISDTGQKAMRRHTLGIKQTVAGMQAAAPDVNAGSALTAMRGSLGQQRKAVPVQSDLSSARSFVREFEQNPELFDAVTDAAGNVVGYTPRDVPMKQFSTVRQSLGSSFKKKTAESSNTFAPSEQLKRTQREGYKAMEAVEDATIPPAPDGTSYKDLQDLRSDLIPAYGIVKRSASNDAHKALFGLANANALGASGAAGSILAIGMPAPVRIASAVGASYAGHHLGNYLKSSGRASAKAAKLFGKAEGAPAWNAMLESTVQPTIASAVNLAPIATSLYDAIRAQGEAEQKKRDEARARLAAASTATP